MLLFVITGWVLVSTLAAGFWAAVSAGARLRRGEAGLPFANRSTVSVPAQRRARADHHALV